MSCTKSPLAVNDVNSQERQARIFFHSAQERQRPIYGRWFYRCNSLYDIDNSNRLAPGKIRDIQVPPQKK